MVDERPTNRLADEMSPYLRQHAHNPVDWYPWGEEAFERARREDRPILLSIGYSACHWCHVMERECFDDPEIAALMNELLVSVKVDREERPDLDQVYQTTVQLLGRSGGWPLTVFLTPEREPYYAGTYFPPVDRFGMAGFPTIVRAVHEAWANKREQVLRSAGELSRAIERVTAEAGEPGDPPRDLLERAARALEQRSDEQHGGFGFAPKFPNTMALAVLLRHHHADGHQASLDRVIGALDGMRNGGIWDHLGGGFHRYSTDERWLVPHFEKMLYDNALLAPVYADAFRVTGEERFAETARATLAWAAREMRAPAGGFYSTQDADSEGEEGRFFVWTSAQLVEVLGEADARVAALHFGVTDAGNFEHGATVLHANRSLEAVARQLGRPEAEIRATMARARERLFEARERREKPFRDEKVITAWNGLMISAFADVGAALGDAALVAVASEALAFHRATSWNDGRLNRICKDGRSRVDAFLEDYGDLCCAAIDLFEVTQDRSALSFARALADAAIERFWDPQDGGFFFAPSERSDLIVRARDAWDNAVPSGTSTLCHALLRLHALTDESGYLDRAEQTLRGLSARAAEQPFGSGHLVAAMDRYLRGPTQVVVVAEADDPAGAALLATALAAYVPNRVLSRVAPGASGELPGASAIGEARVQRSEATAWVCRERVCGAPATTPEALCLQLGEGRAEPSASR